MRQTNIETKGTRAKYYYYLIKLALGILTLCCSLKGLNKSSNIAAGRLLFIGDQRQACNYLRDCQ